MQNRLILIVIEKERGKSHGEDSKEHFKNAAVSKTADVKVTGGGFAFRLLFDEET